MPENEAEQQRRERRNVEAGTVETPAHRQDRDHRVVPPLGSCQRPLGRFEDAERGRRLLRHHDPDRAEQKHVEDRDHGIDLAQILKQPEEQAAQDRAQHAARDDHRAHLHVDPAPALVGEHARDRGAGDLRRRRSHGHSGRDAVEDQDRRRQETAADADHAGEQSDQPAEADDHQRVHRQARDRQIDIHRETTLMGIRGRRKARRA